MFPTTAPTPNEASSQAGDARVGAEAGDDQHRHADEESRPTRRPRPRTATAQSRSSALADEEANALDATPVSSSRMRRPARAVRHEPGDQRHRDDVGGRVDDEHHRGGERPR